MPSPTSTAPRLVDPLASATNSTALRQRLVAVAEDPAAIETLVGRASVGELLHLTDQNLSRVGDDYLIWTRMLRARPAGQGGVGANPSWLGDVRQIPSGTPLAPPPPSGSAQDRADADAARAYSQRVASAVQRRAVAKVLAEPAGLWSPLLTGLMENLRYAQQDAPRRRPATEADPWGPGGLLPFLTPLAARAEGLRVDDPKELLAVQEKAGEERTNGLAALLALVQAPWDAETANRLVHNTGARHATPVLWGLMRNPSVSDAVWAAVLERSLDTAMRDDATSLLDPLDWEGRAMGATTHDRLVRHVLASNLRAAPHATLQRLLSRPSVRADARVIGFVGMLDTVAHPVVRGLVDPGNWYRTWQAMRADGDRVGALSLWYSLDARHADALGDAEWHAILTDAEWASLMGRDEGGPPPQLASHLLQPHHVRAWSAATLARILTDVPRDVRLGLLALRAEGVEAGGLAAQDVSGEGAGVQDPGPGHDAEAKATRRPRAAGRTR